MKTTIITEILVKDIRFPTSKTFDGSDAMNPDPDYSAAYVILRQIIPKILKVTDYVSLLEEEMSCV
jgi:L-fuconate dehydratase